MRVAERELIDAAGHVSLADVVKRADDTALERDRLMPHRVWLVANVAMFLSTTVVALRTPLMGEARPETERTAKRKRH
jgi:hypothetical protein